ncbi:putative sam-dependent methyltransferase [Rosellinia necatrix]|uniref:Putative sam-dependent methyltransferase n=1 Tax=Rosellinia necatrix TaxID=77044 RepID=A0A1W2THT4_ROSNE|nr:putative sam-dependent methyltransferase [Rosellinia necatrix]
MSVASQTAAQGPGLYATIYTPTFLSLVYDVIVLRFNLRYMWRCRTDTVLEPFFAENLSRHHLDIGVATGYFLDVSLSRPFRAQAKHSVTLVDLNPHPLNAARARILSRAPNTTVETVVADVTEPPPEMLRNSRFDSISMFNLFHCVPGRDKLRAFSLYKGLLAEGGTLTGCTVLGGSHATNWLNYLYVKLYNHLGIFHNWDDRKEDFDRALNENFEDVETTLVGMTLLFRATKPRNPHSMV